MKRASIFIVLFAMLAILPLACTKTADERGEVNQTAENTQASASDAAITAKVKTKFAGDDVVEAKNIDVETNNGVVTLRGTVSSQREADRAFQVASNVEGVRDVRSYLKTQAASNEGTEKDISDELEDTAKKTGESLEEVAEKVGETAKDAKITAAIKMKLAKDDLVKSSDIEVETDNGNVTLNGKVSSPAEEKRAIQIARATNDVREVHSNLTVQ